MTQEVLAGWVNHFIMVYLDDVVIYSTNPKEHLYHLRLVFERIYEHGLRCNLEKCSFGQTQISYLGHHVGPLGNSPQVEHVQAITSAKPPTNRKRLRRFLGIANWLRDYIPKFAILE